MVGASFSEGEGFDIDDNLLDQGRELARQRGVGHLCSFINQDLFSIDLPGCDLLYLFLLPTVLASLAPRLTLLLRERGHHKPFRIVSNTWPIPDLEQYLVPGTGAGKGFYLYSSKLGN